MSRIIIRVEHAVERLVELFPVFKLDAGPHNFENGSPGSAFIRAGGQPETHPGYLIVPPLQQGLDQGKLRKDVFFVQVLFDLINTAEYKGKLVVGFLPQPSGSKPPFAWFWRQYDKGASIILYAQPQKVGDINAGDGLLSDQFPLAQEKGTVNPGGFGVGTIHPFDPGNPAFLTVSKVDALFQFSGKRDHPGDVHQDCCRFLVKGKGFALHGDSLQVRIKSIAERQAEIF